MLVQAWQPGATDPVTFTVEVDGSLSLRKKPVGFDCTRMREIVSGSMPVLGPALPSWRKEVARVLANEGFVSRTKPVSGHSTETATSSRPARDMKPGLLSGPHAQMGAHGRYNVIPMRHRAEDLSSDAVMALVQNLRNFRSLTGLRSKLTPVGPYTWTTGHESGIRMGRSGPVTFRTVSDRSPAASWWYPALPENPILDAVWAMVREDVGDMVFRSWVEALGMEEGGGAI